MKKLLKPGGEPLFMGHKREALLFFAMLLMVFIIGTACAFKIDKDVEIVLDTNVNQIGGPKQSMTVTAGLMDTVEQTIEDAGITLTDEMTVSPKLSTRIVQVDQIVVTDKVDGVIKVDGEEIPFFTAADTVMEVLNEYGISLGEHDEVSPSKYALISKDCNVIEIHRIEYKTESRQTEIAYTTTEQENDEVEQGTNTVLQTGQNGLEMLVEIVTYRDGEAAERRVIADVNLITPVTEIVEVGTKDPNGASTGNATAAIGDQMDFICAVVAQEGGCSYEGALAVISCIMNRVDHGGWGGSDVISVITAPGQFSAYLDGAYEKYLGASLPEVRQAVTDCMENGIRSHNYMSFRGYYVEGALNICGNYYFNPL